MDKTISAKTETVDKRIYSTRKERLLPNIENSMSMKRFAGAKVIWGDHIENLVITDYHLSIKLKNKQEIEIWYG